MPTPFIAYLAGIGTVIVSLGAGFAGGALVGAYWGPKEPPIVATAELQPGALVQRREIPLVQAARQPSDIQISAIKATDKADPSKLAAERKIAVQRKLAAERRKIEKAGKREAERKKQIAIAAAGQQAEEEKATTQASGFAPVAARD